MRYIYFARSMKAQTRTDLQTTDSNKVLHDTVVEAIRANGHRPQFDITVNFSRSAFDSYGDASYIYARDIAWLEQCSHLIAEVSEPSTGVGYEIAYAKHVMRLDNILCVALKDTRVSAMIAGNLAVVYYRDLSDLSHVITDWLPVAEQA